MSAIFGLINLDGRLVAGPELELMGAALAQYGPDGKGIWTDGHVGLGQRLMRFTPEDYLERQPAFSRDRQHVLVSDARIDNRSELMHELGIPPAEARGLPDSAFILRAYDKWGADCARHLIGAFAFALCDSRERSILLARSPMAERSLFYCETSGTFAFASAPKGLFALPFVPRNVNRQSIADFLVFSANEPGTSYFSGINRLKAGHSIVIQGARVRSRSYRQLDIGEIRFPRDSDYVEAFNALFDRVVADQLRSRTPIGVSLSGGLDSTSIAAAAALKLRQEGQRLHTFTAVPPVDCSGALPNGWYADETPFVRAMARKYDNLDVHFVRSDGRFYLDELNPFFSAAEAPILGAANMTWTKSLQQEARQRNVRVLLTGTPGNFTISYEGQGLLAQLVRERKLVQAIRQAHALAGPHNIQSLMGIIAGRGLMPLLPDPLWVMAKQLRAHRIPGLAPRPFWTTESPLHPEFARTQRIEERVRDIIHHFRPCLGPASRAMGMLWRADRRADARRGEAALHGVQKLDLPADVRLVEFCLSIPEDQYLRDGTSRWLIRRAGLGRLPEEVRANKRRGFQAADWFESMTAARSLLSQELARLEHSALASEMIDLARLRRLIEQLPAAQDEGGRALSDYRGVLEAGITTGRFLAWVESGR